MGRLHKYQVRSDVQDVKPFLLWATAKNILPAFIVLFGVVLLYVCCLFLFLLQLKHHNPEWRVLT